MTSHDINELALMDEPKMHGRKGRAATDWTKCGQCWKARRVTDLINFATRKQKDAFRRR